MRFIKGFVLFIIVAVITFIILDEKTIESKEAFDSVGHILTQKKQNLLEKSVPKNVITKQTYQGEVFKWMGKGTEELIESLGEPKRKDLTSYGYTWWIYTDGQTEYLQFGIMHDTVQTIYAAGSSVSIEPFNIGDHYPSIHEQVQFLEEVTYNEGISSYTFLLDEQDLTMRPLVKLADNLFLQLYFDTFTDKLSSVRIMTGDVLLMQRPYGLKYRGALPELPILTEEDWKLVESGMEKQIFDLTNVIRHSFNKKTLTWEDKVSEVAFLHSKDMAQNNYFSHYSLNGNGLKERLEDKSVYYFAAGENIAAQYVDAPAAVEGWLNSEGHRDALLNDKYTHLGVGVYRLYYTQNFLTKPF